MNSKEIKIFTIPNFITLLNLFSGCLAIIYAFHGMLITASWLIFIAGLLDFFDGMAARLLKAYSEIGKQLDSLADIVSFGVAPSVIVFYLYLNLFKTSQPEFTFQTAGFLQKIILFSPFIIAAFSALRLAKFNIDERQSDSFIGVPTPANGFMIASLPFIIQKYPQIGDSLSFSLLIPITIVLSVLLISEIPLMSLKFKNIKFHDNKLRYFIIIISAVLLILFQIAAFPLIFILYILISLIFRKYIH